MGLVLEGGHQITVLLDPAVRSTSSQVTGAETVGSSRPRSEYGATVVFAALFWLQSTSTLPARARFSMREITRSRCSISRRSARRRAYPWTSSTGALPSGATYICIPLEPLVFG